MSDPPLERVDRMICGSLRRDARLVPLERILDRRELSIRASTEPLLGATRSANAAELLVEIADLFSSSPIRLRLSARSTSNCEDRSAP